MFGRSELPAHVYGIPSFLSETRAPNDPFHQERKPRPNQFRIAGLGPSRCHAVPSPPVPFPSLTSIPSSFGSSLIFTICFLLHQLLIRLATISCRFYSYGGTLWSLPSCFHCLTLSFTSSDIIRVWDNWQTPNFTERNSHQISYTYSLNFSNTTLFTHMYSRARQLFIIQTVSSHVHVECCVCCKKMYWRHMSSSIETIFIEYDTFLDIRLHGSVRFNVQFNFVAQTFTRTSVSLMRRLFFGPEKYLYD